MRAVLNTNVLISGLLWHGASHECLLAAEAGMFDLILCPGILDELREKLIHHFGNTDDEADETVAELRRSAEFVTLTGQSGWVPNDPDDDKIVETALVGAADVIVSGDRDLLNLQRLEGTPILTPRQFLLRLASES